MRWILGGVILGVALRLGIAFAQVPVRPTTPDEEAEARRAFMFAEQQALVRALFSSGSMTPRCFWELADPGMPANRYNWRLVCDGTVFSYCDIAGVHCD